jgi:FemAB-related protein (PEP-CTERM system-associated)
MTSPVEIATDRDAAEWDDFVRAHPDATGYHEWAWRHVFKRALGHDSFYLIARERGGMVGSLPLVHIKSPIFGRTLTSLAFLNYGGLVATSETAAAALVNAARALAAKLRCHHVELRHKSRRVPELPYRQHKVAMLLPLQPGMWDRLDRKVRNQIRKAEKSGLTVEEGDARLLPEFYEVFARNMRDLGTPVYSSRLFAEVLSAFPSRACVRVVRAGSKPVAAGLTFRTGQSIEVPWASSIRDFNTMCPNHLLYWSAIESAVRDGCDTFDFGRSTPNEGTYKFKEQWGAQPVPLYWEYVLADGAALPNLGPSNPRFHLMIEAWKKLPLKVATTLGPHVVRGIP